MHWFDRLKSVPVFVDFSTILLYFPNEIVPCLKTTITYGKMYVNKWIQLIIDHDIDVVLIKISNSTLHCALNRRKVESFFDHFPVLFPDSLWSNGNLHFKFNCLIITLFKIKSIFSNVEISY